MAETSTTNDWGFYGMTPAAKKDVGAARNSAPKRAERVLVLGASGMLGHKVAQRLSRSRPVCATLRACDTQVAAVLPGVRIVTGVRAEDMHSVLGVVEQERPTAIINCIGIIKQHAEAAGPVSAIELNALFPQRLAELAVGRGIRLVHFSTDCVFSGLLGGYREEDPSDALDLYGRTKALGEVSRPGCLTIRSSIVGHELKHHLGLFDWFLSQRGRRVSGYARAFYTGVTTIVMADLVERFLTDWADLDGVWQVASERICKYDLLSRINEVYDLGIDLARDEDFFCDRSLDGSRFADRTGWRAPSWDEMVRNLHADFLSSQ